MACIAEAGPGVIGEFYPTEMALLDRVVAIVREVDPDVVVGFDVQGGSVGYLIDRAARLERGEEQLLILDF